MAKRKRIIKKALERVQQESMPILESAVMTGVGRFSSELRGVGDASANLPNATVLGKVSEALKAGFFAAAQELLDRGMDRLGTDESEDINSTSLI